MPARRIRRGLRAGHQSFTSFLVNTHYYPSNLTPELQARWPVTAPALPPARLVEQFISVAYQASLLQEEGRPVRCRLLLSAPTDLPALPPTSAQHVLPLAVPRPYDAQEIRRLSPALQSPDSILAVQATATADLLMWGILRRPHAWDQEAGTWLAPPVAAPLALLLDVRGPGSLDFYCGSQRLLTLQQGAIDGHGFLEYPVAWGRGRFGENVRAVRHRLPQADAKAVPGLRPLLVQLWANFVWRVISRVRHGGHGGMLAFLPTEKVAEYVGPAATLRPKYQVQTPAGDPYYIDLTAAIVRRLLELGSLSWPRYQQATDAHLVELQGTLGRYADLLADLMTVDGALVLTKQLAIVGFGMEVYAPHLPLTDIYRALNAQGSELRAEAPDGGGTRHRAAYRLCLAQPDSVAIVVSQDGGLRFVHSQAPRIVFWEQLTLSTPLR